MNKVQGKGWWEYKRSVKPDKFEANVTAGNMGLVGLLTAQTVTFLI